MMNRRNPNNMFIPKHKNVELELETIHSKKGKHALPPFTDSGFVAKKNQVVLP